MNQYPELTKEELEALEYWRATNGNRWRSKLHTAWMKADIELPTILYALRNTHGPSWLQGFKFPDVKITHPIAPSKTKFKVGDRVRTNSRTNAMNRVSKIVDMTTSDYGKLLYWLADGGCFGEEELEAAP